jgi:putative ATPase
MADLFTREGAGPPEGPLADRMRPQTLDEVIGQDHIVGPGRLLRRAIQADRLSSLIFYGPPGTGKTSLARVIANTTRAYFESLNAVLAGKADIREAIDRADEHRRLYGRRTILFVDEVHRWNKAQQDALLPWVENGVVILIGATTENPFFEVNRALVSRSRIFQLKPLTPPDLLLAARRAVENAERGYGKWQVAFEDGALEHLVEVAGGDARSLLNALELAIETSPWTILTPGKAGDEDAAGEAGALKNSFGFPPPPGAVITVSMEAAEESIQKRAVLYDRDGDYHFDTISAFIKSMRGSDPDAALYWLAKMVRAGEDPAFIFRRMIILASEDVGMADPSALQVVISCAEAFDRIGFPEGNFPLAHACLYLATAPKSNSAMAFFDALAQVDAEDAEVPNHLRDASRDAEGFGHGEGYIYPHAYRDHWAAQQYLPGVLRGKTFYSPSVIGYEGKIREEVIRKREIQAAVILSDTADGEFLSWSASSKGREGWFKRLESGRSALLLADRDRILAQCSINRHDRILIPAAADGLLLWECLRRVPEGLAAALVESPAARDALLRFAEVLVTSTEPRRGESSPLGESEQPLVACTEYGVLPEPDAAAAAFGTAVFDHILSREPWRRGFGGEKSEEAFAVFARRAAALLAPGGNLVILQSPPRQGERLSRIIAEACAPPEVDSPLANSPLADLPLAGRFARAEEDFYASPAGEAWWTWEASLLTDSFTAAGFDAAVTELDQKEERLLTERDLSSWFDREKSTWGNRIAAVLGEQDFNAARELLAERAKRGPLTWKWKSLLLTARKK